MDVGPNFPRSVKQGYKKLLLMLKILITVVCFNIYRRQLIGATYYILKLITRLTTTLNITRLTSLQYISQPTAY